ncbi:hypothetical protein ACFW3D_28410 [Streptomyces sp. NPDC058864]
MGEASRRKKQRGAVPSPQRRSRGLQPPSREEAERALERLMRANAPGKMSLAGAYAFGYGVLGFAQTQDEEPDWYQGLDPLDALFLGTAFPGRFRDEYEFANARNAWLELLRGTVHWAGIEGFVHEVVAASEEHDLPVDDGQMMMLLHGYLEDIGLDQRKLPRDLLPATALHAARAIYGPSRDAQLPAAPDDASEQVAQFWHSTTVELPHDGTALDALREGINLLDEAGLPVREEAALLLPALYLALVAADDEDLEEAGARAAAWACGLPEHSPLLPVVDLLLIAPDRGLAVDEVLTRLLVLPASTQPVAPEDRLWRSSPGRALTDLAFGLGYAQVVTRDGTITRISQDASAALQAQVRAFEEKFGRPPSGDDPIFFDPDADSPQTLSLAKVEEEGTALLKTLGLSPSWIYAYRQTDGLLPQPDGTFRTERDAAEWQEALDRYTALHGDQGSSEEDNLPLLRAQLISGQLVTAAKDPQYGAALVQMLHNGSGSDLLNAYLHQAADELAARLRAEPALQTLAREYARAWGGLPYDERVQVAIGAPDSATADTAVLLVAAVAAIGLPPEPDRQGRG